MLSFIYKLLEISGNEHKGTSRTLQEYLKTAQTSLKNKVDTGDSKRAAEVSPFKDRDESSKSSGFK